jgi:hypothetical protein
MFRADHGERPPARARNQASRVLAARVDASVVLDDVA